ncbi:hypothetical protein MY4824_003103 [Beauveria thailandica]
MSKSLELVQAILVFLAWNDIYFFAASRDTSLLQLAIGVVVDLGLTRAQSSRRMNTASIVDEAAELKNESPARPKHTANGYRTVLGLYYMTSCLCSLLGRRYWFEYMPCFSDYCTQLAQEQVHPTDSFLVELVRVRNLADQANAIFWQLIETHDKTQASAGSMHHIAVSSIKKSLEVYQRQIPLRFKDNQLLQMHCAAVCIRLFEPGAPSGGPATQQPPINRSQLIWDCLQSTRTLYEAFCAVPLDCYPYLTFDTILHLALALIKSSRLLFLTDETWDAQAARSVYKLSDILQHLGKLFEAANDLGHARCGIHLHGRPIFSDYAHSYRSMDLCYLSQAAAASQQPRPMSAEGDDITMWTQLLDFAPDNMYDQIGHTL